MKRALLLPLVLVAAGCSSRMPGVLTPNEGVRDELRTLRAQVVELQRKAAVSEVEIARLREKVAQLEDEAESPPAVPARSPAPIVEPAPVAVEPRPVIVERTFDQDPVEPPIARPVTPPAESPDPQPGASVEPPPELVPPPAAPVTATTPVPAEGQAIYDRGYTLYHQGQFVEAEASFQRFLQGFAGTDLADNALYWIGEARFARRDFRGALAAFRETIDRYPAGNKIPDSLLKAGDALEQLGDIEGARQSYSEVQRRFPETALALIAAERLAKLP
jgi:tol-pal system protein YbgF